MATCSKTKTDAFSSQMFYIEIVASHLPFFNLMIDKTSFYFKDVKSTGSKNKEELCAIENHTLRQIYYVQSKSTWCYACTKKIFFLLPSKQLPVIAPHI